MKNTRRRKGKAKAKEKARAQISDASRQKEDPGHRACWSDSDSPPSKFVRYDSEIAGDFTKEGLKYFESVIGVRRSVVSLSCTIGVKQRFCSGTVVDHVRKQIWILTSAELVRKSGTRFEAYARDEIKIEVALHNKETIKGSLEMCNLHYNIAIVTIEYPGSLIYEFPAVELSDLPECYTLQPRPVVALGRDIDSKAFLVRCGDLVRKKCDLDCGELLVCTCNVSQDFIGGPVMDSEKRFLGITFSFEETAPFLPVEIAARCLKYFKMQKTLPWLRIRGRALHTLDLDVLESICCKFARPPSGVLVRKICDISTKNYGGIEVGDIITELGGVTLYSVAQFTAMFLDKLEAAIGTQNTVTLEAVVQRCTDKTTFVAKLNVQEVASDEFDKSFQNRWMQYRTYGFGEDLEC